MSENLLLPVNKQHFSYSGKKKETTLSERLFFEVLCKVGLAIHAFFRTRLSLRPDRQARNGFRSQSRTRAAKKSDGLKPSCSLFSPKKRQYYYSNSAKIFMVGVLLYLGGAAYSTVFAWTADPNTPSFAHFSQATQDNIVNQTSNDTTSPHLNQFSPAEQIAPNTDTPFLAPSTQSANAIPANAATLPLETQARSTMLVQALEPNHFQAPQASQNSQATPSKPQRVYYPTCLLAQDLGERFCRLLPSDLQQSTTWTVSGNALVISGPTQALAIADQLVPRMDACIQLQDGHVEVGQPNAGPYAHQNENVVPASGTSESIKTPESFQYYDPNENRYVQTVYQPQNAIFPKDDTVYRYDSSAQSNDPATLSRASLTPSVAMRTTQNLDAVPPTSGQSVQELAPSNLSATLPVQSTQPIQSIQPTFPSSAQQISETAAAPSSPTTGAVAAPAQTLGQEVVTYSCNPGKTAEELDALLHQYFGSQPNIVIATNVNTGRVLVYTTPDLQLIVQKFLEKYQIFPVSQAIEQYDPRIQTGTVQPILGKRTPDVPSNPNANRQSFVPKTRPISEIESLIVRLFEDRLERTSEANPDPEQIPYSERQKSFYRYTKRQDQEANTPLRCCDLTFDPLNNAIQVQGDAEMVQQMLQLLEWMDRNQPQNGNVRRFIFIRNSDSNQLQEIFKVEQQQPLSFFQGKAVVPSALEQLSHVAAADSDPSSVSRAFLNSSEPGALSAKTDSTASSASKYSIYPFFRERQIETDTSTLMTDAAKHPVSIALAKSFSHESDQVRATSIEELTTKNALSKSSTDGARFALDSARSSTTEDMAAFAATNVSNASFVQKLEMSGSPSSNPIQPVHYQEGLGDVSLGGGGDLDLNAPSLEGNPGMQASGMNGPNAPGMGFGGFGRQGVGVVQDYSPLVLPQLDVVIIDAPEAEYERIRKMIEDIEELAKLAEYKIEMYHLKYVHCVTLQNILQVLNGSMLTNRQGRVIAYAMQNPNALLLVGWGSAFQAMKDLIEVFDKPIQSENSLMRVIRLKYASANEMSNQITKYFPTATGTTGGFAPRIRVFPDIRTNSLIVQAAPNDLVEIQRLLSELDINKADVRLRVRTFPLKNSLAQDIRTTLMNTILTASQGTLETSAAKYPVLEVLSVDSQNRRLIESGIMMDVSIVADVQHQQLIVTAPEDCMDLMEQLIKLLDVATPRAQIKIIQIKYGDASQIVETLTSLFASGDATSKPTIPQAEGETSFVPVRFAKDTRTNTIIVAASPKDLQMIFALVASLDRQDSQMRKEVVVPLRNTNALAVAEAIDKYLAQKQTLEIESAALSPYQMIESNVIVIPETYTNTIIISATSENLDKILEMIQIFDQDPLKVVIQVLIAEVNLNSAEEFGVEAGLQDSVSFDRSLITTSTNVRGTTGDPGYDIINGSGPGKNMDSGTDPSDIAGQVLNNFGMGTTSSDLNFGGLVLSASSRSVQVTLRALKEKNRLQILSRPQITAMDNSQAFILVGQRVPRVGGGNMTEYGVSTNVSDEPVGLILLVTPRVTSDGRVIMEIGAEKSSLGSASESVAVFSSDKGTITSPPIDTIQAMTAISAHDGETVMLGGLITSEKEKVVRGVPYLSEIPVLGRLFRYDRDVEQRKELLIVMTPRIVRNSEDVDEIKRIEAARLNWVLNDAMSLHGNMGLFDPLSGNGPESEKTKLQEFLCPDNLDDLEKTGKYNPNSDYPEKPIRDVNSVNRFEQYKTQPTQENAPAPTLPINPALPENPQEGLSPNDRSSNFAPLSNQFSMQQGLSESQSFISNGPAAPNIPANSNKTIIQNTSAPQNMSNMNGNASLITSSAGYSENVIPISTMQSVPSGVAYAQPSGAVIATNDNVSPTIYNGPSQNASQSVPQSMNRSWQEAPPLGDVNTYETQTGALPL